jgi:hypothetical protein
MKKLILTLSLVGLMTVTSICEAGRIGGPGGDAFTVQGYGSVTYNITFEGGRPAEVAIIGDGRTDLDIFVYDANGRLVAQGIGPTDIETVRWTPPQQQTYRIVVVNLGNSPNRYGFGTN